ncbi:MAG: transglycosylase SLT domain-containing protein [Candidatus Moranbacteria bacterium]|nr:transglycosylase SLT domain-containing protein [Candidatus Moranbacteria bacterium]
MIFMNNFPTNPFNDDQNRNSFPDQNQNLNSNPDFNQTQNQNFNPAAPQTSNRNMDIKPPVKNNNKNKKFDFINILLFIIYTGLSLGLIGFLAYELYLKDRGGFGSNIFYNKNSNIAVKAPGEINFCAEKAPLDKFYVRQDWEKDFHIVSNNDYQNILYLKRSGKYFPYIEEQLKKRGMPEDLKYLAVAESALVDNAISTKGAAGIWQFIPSTAKKYGLVVNNEIDERRNFKKATDAALDYLEDLYDRFDNWTLAAAAYNTGPGNISKSLETQEVKNYYDLYLNRETSRYIYRILAIKEVMKNANKYGYRLDKKDYYSFPKYIEVQVEEIVNLSEWAKENNSNLKAIKELNPWLVGYSITKEEEEEEEEEQQGEIENASLSQQESNPVSTPTPSPFKQEEQEKVYWMVKVPLNE